MMKRTIKNSLSFLTHQLHIIITALVSFFNLPALAQDSIYTNYLKQNGEKIVIAGNNRFELFNKAFYKNQVFFLSESHGYDKPHEVDFELFRHLHQKTGVRYYLAEMDVSQAYYLNQYLGTGNETFFKDIYQYWYNQKAQWGCKAGFEKWKKMFTYNKTLPAEKKIIVLGLDEAQDLNMNIKLVNELMGKTDYKRGKEFYLDSLAVYANMNLEKSAAEKMFRMYSRSLDSLIASNTGMYEKLLGNQFVTIRYIIHNIASKKGREKKIFENFNHYYSHLKLSTQKLYGFWGRFHAMQDSVNHSMPFAGMLKNSNLPLKEKVVSIPVFCVESSSMIPTAFLPPMAQQEGTIYTKAGMVNDDSFVYQVTGITAFKSLIEKNSMYIFKLDGTNSPYLKGLNLMESTSKMDKTFEWTGNRNAATTDYFKYAIIVRNAGWAIPYGDNKAK